MSNLLPPAARSVVASELGMSRVSTLTLAQCKQSFATGLGTTTLGTAAPVRDQTSVSNKKKNTPS